MFLISLCLFASKAPHQGRKQKIIYGRKSKKYATKSVEIATQRSPNQALPTSPCLFPPSKTQGKSCMLHTSLLGMAFETRHNAGCKTGMSLFCSGMALITQHGRHFVGLPYILCSKHISEDIQNCGRFGLLGHMLPLLSKKNHVDDKMVTL